MKKPNNMCLNFGDVYTHKYKKYSALPIQLYFTNSL